MPDLSPDDILIRFAGTPNPKAIKVITNFSFKKTGKANFTSKESCSHLPLLASLFDLGDVEQVYVMENQMTITFKNEIEDLTKKLESIIRTRFAVHNSDFKTQEEDKKTKDKAGLPEHIRQVEEILDRTIRPGLQADGGDLDLISFNGNIIEISYQGACGGCASSYTGTLEAIENILRHELNNENIEVHPV